MVTVAKRPQGHKLIDQGIDATIIDDSGDALVVFPYHSLETGDYVYIESDIDEYNGFMYLTAISAGTFKISDHATAEFVAFYQEIDITYYQTQEHDWNAIFLPIIYKITNDKWPTNSTDPVRTVVSSADDNGFTSLVLSGAIRATVNALEFVTVTGDQAGVWQVVEVISTSEIVINLPYDEDNVFTGVQYYYNNYQARVKIFAGLPSDHPWEPYKPFEEVADLSLTPEDTNEVIFSVSDYIQSKVKIANNLTLYSLPLNLDAFTGFYISTGETYDQSDNYTLYTTDTVFFQDEFTGYAVAGKLPFKNLYAGDYADYVYTSGSPALWLVNLRRLLAVDGLFFDVSFIKNVIGSFKVFIDKYLSSDYSLEEQIAFDDMGIGVYRIPITPDANYQSFCVRVVVDEHEEEVPPEALDLSTLSQQSSGGYEWVLGDQPYVPPPVGAFAFRALYVLKNVALGATLKINYRMTTTATTTIYFILGDDSSFAVNDSVSENLIGADTHTGSKSVTATADRTYFGITVTTGTADNLIMLNAISFGDPTTITVPAATITEEICIDIIEQCDVQNGLTQDGIRLLEDGGYRLLE